MNIYFSDRLTKEGTYWEVSTRYGDFKKILPEDLPEYIYTQIQKLRISQTWYIHNLTTYKDDFIRALYIAGVNFIDGNPKISKMSDMDCKYLISGDMAQVYHMTIKNHGHSIIMLDSDNILPNEEKVMKTWGRHEKFAYVQAYKRAIEDFEKMTYVKRTKPMTTSAGARRTLKKKIPGFARLDANKAIINDKTKETLDDFVRPSYHGGLCTYKNDEKYIKRYGEGICLDVTSLYPYIMVDKPLPIGMPKTHPGAPTEEEVKDFERGRLAIWVKIEATFRLKPGGIPCVRFDDFLHQDGWATTSGYSHADGTIQETINGKPIVSELTLTYMDFTDLLQNYDISYLNVKETLTMVSVKGSFTPIIRYLYKIKRHSEGGRRELSKVLLNSLSGLVSRRKEYTGYTINFKDGKLFYETEKTEGGKSYIYIGSYITSWGRHMMIDYIRRYYDRWIYTDTDCLFFEGVDIPEEFEIGEGLGKFKIEKEFDEIVIYKQKQYGYKKDGKIKLTIAGVSDIDKKKIEEDKLPIKCYFSESDKEEIWYRYMKSAMEREGYDINDFIDDDDVGNIFIKVSEVLTSPESEPIINNFFNHIQDKRFHRKFDLEHGIHDIKDLLEVLPEMSIPCTYIRGFDFERYSYQTTRRFSDVREWR